ncbi:MAG: BolA family transcriptional regulator [Myxococcales bacterium]|nr:BolA family transcriptional regulator [Myxococcales bacterium]
MAIPIAASPMQAFIEKRLSEAFPEADVEVRDTTGGGDHFQVDIASKQFIDLSRIEQHRMVYAALGERVGHEIHALGLRTRLPE